MYYVQGWVERSPIAQEQSTEAHSSSGLGHRPLKAEITGSNPVCAIKHTCCSITCKETEPVFLLEEENRLSFLAPSFITFVEFR
jgi:hypothetical protein